MDTPLFKDMFDHEFVHQVCDKAKDAYPDFPKTDFMNFVLDGSWERKELKQRIRHLSIALGRYLPDTYEEALPLLMDIGSHFRGMHHLIFPDFVEVHGLDHLHLSAEALRELTSGCSSESAVRPFILRYEKEMLQYLYEWTKHESEDVRRLASEGCRPRLPWSMALPRYKKDPTPILHILEALKNDPSEYVRRSVANNLNDISKDNPEIVLELAAQWIGQTPETDKLVKHACRTLLKAGDIQAMRLFGFAEPTDIEVENLQFASDPIRIGDKELFSFELVNNGEEKKLRIEYGMWFRKKSGIRSRKIFQIKEREYPHGRILIKKNHNFRQRTTRKHIAGEQELEVLVNGVSKAVLTFELID